MGGADAKQTPPNRPAGTRQTLGPAIRARMDRCTFPEVCHGISCPIVLGHARCRVGVGAMKSVGDRLQALVRQTVQDRDWICTGDIAQGAAAHARALHSLGARRCLVLAGTMGTGPCDLPQGAVLHLLGLRETSFLDGIHAMERSLQSLPPSVQQAVEAFDPRGAARVVGPLYAWNPCVAGRTLLGGRPAAWRALEDKLVVDALWDAVGVPRVPSCVVPVCEPSLEAAHRSLDAGSGTVWAADNSQGWHGGAAGTRWVRQDLAGALAWAADRAKRVRVMPFLEGIPCSIHGMVLPDGVVVLRPLEMMVLRNEADAFVYARAASGWRPPQAEAAAMRSAARRVGAHLRHTVDYRGVFTIDGVLTHQGFRPTELNPRFGAALDLLLSDQPGLHPYLLHLCIADGAEPRVPATEVEGWLMDVAEKSRAATAFALLKHRPATEREATLVLAPSGWRVARADEPADAHARLGPSVGGGIVIVHLQKHAVPDGPPAAPVVVSLLAHLDAAWGLGLGRLRSARAAKG